MHFPTTTTITALAFGLAAAQNASTTPGYDSPPNSITPTIPTSNTNLTFGQHYAVLNLDLINGLVSTIADTPQGQTFIANTARWINKVHEQKPAPLSIFSRIYYSNAKKPELGPQTPFRKAGGMLGTITDPNTQIFPAFLVREDEGDVVVQKTRYYAGFGNELEEILSTQKIDTVILSGIRTSGVILNTVYQLFNLNYNVYVIANNTIETPPDTPGINKAILEGIIPKLPADVITIEQAEAALARSGPAVY